MARREVRFFMMDISRAAGEFSGGKRSAIHAGSLAGGLRAPARLIMDTG
jgi:hypothetical protein